jgi:hypothetical protein
MSEIQTNIEKLKSETDVVQKMRVTHYFINVFRQASQQKKPIASEDRAALTAFVSEEMESLAEQIPKQPNYRKKDELFGYEDALLGLFAMLSGEDGDPTEKQLETITTLVLLVASERVLENAVDDAFKLEEIDVKEIDKVLKLAASLTDEYQRGLLFQGLLNYKESLNKISDEAKNAVSNYFVSEFERYAKKKNGLSDDEINNLEIACDVCKFFLNAEIIELLKDFLKLDYINVCYYAIDTLLGANETIGADIAAKMAADLTYSYMTYYLLKRHKLERLFPRECSTPEYLAKSDMVHWLTYPTELGKVPDKIELLGDIKVKKERFFVFKYMSNSDTLDDEHKNVWLIGWSSDDGETFSNFDKLSLFEKKTNQKTLKNIKKRLL